MTWSTFMRLSGHRAKILMGNYQLGKESRIHVTRGKGLKQQRLVKLQHSEAEGPQHTAVSLAVIAVVNKAA